MWYRLSAWRWCTVSSFTVPNHSVRWVLLCSLFTEEGTEVQRSWRLLQVPKARVREPGRPQVRRLAGTPSLALRAPKCERWPCGRELTPRAQAPGPHWWQPGGEVQERLNSLRGDRAWQDGPAMPKPQRPEGAGDLPGSSGGGTGPAPASCAPARPAVPAPPASPEPTRAAPALPAPGRPPLVPAARSPLGARGGGRRGRAPACDRPRQAGPRGRPGRRRGRGLGTGCGWDTFAGAALPAGGRGKPPPELAVIDG